MSAGSAEYGEKASKGTGSEASSSSGLLAGAGGAETSSLSFDVDGEGGEDRGDSDGAGDDAGVVDDAGAADDAGVADEAGAAEYAGDGDEVGVAHDAGDGDDVGVADEIGDGDEFGDDVGDGNGVREGENGDECGDPRKLRTRFQVKKLAAATVTRFDGTSDGLLADGGGTETSLLSMKEKRTE
ncbi:unnamed protein product [Sphenostylis stenocarpa]|uniref:Uncharacterized protein n=1 Tax=Sphenostylis stenocarpa TaxID=92480 RepID=A0AA86S8Q9_9FABA|nr:unnamed protein product [Sphenostylis stenocarpa]